MELVSYEWWALCFRWLHILSGIMWIGHLWYFNFTQTPTMPKIPMELRPAISRFILPEALWWFRWGAMATIVTGLILAWMNGYLGNAIKLGIGDGNAKFTTIGFGMWLGTIMWFNVWFIIWPNQKKVLGLTPANDDAKKVAARTAGLTSRINTLLSIPMLYCMAGASHFY
ncbi:MAG TPA: urate hydroxylase PuuD [Stellaceae bacterium]|nr:urate hydroxylase PuuD [Stellaceae bacterium]